MLGVGIWSRIQSKDYDTLLGSGGLTSAANIMIAAGCFVMVIGFVGCCGAMKESKWLLVIVCIHTCSLSVLFIILVFIILVLSSVEYINVTYKQGFRGLPLSFVSHSDYECSFYYNRHGEQEYLLKHFYLRLVTAIFGLGL